MILIFLLVGMKALEIHEMISQNENEILNLKKELENLKLQNSCRILSDAKKRIELDTEIESLLKTDNKNLGFALELLTDYNFTKEIKEKNEIIYEILEYLLHCKNHLALLSNETMKHFLEINEFLKESNIKKYSLDMIDLNEKISELMEFLDGESWDDGINLDYDSNEECKRDISFSEVIRLFEDDDIGTVFI